ncbi:hypothetical protein B1199_07085 [Pseudoalteromonas ulvae]|uniref:AB hydrolase-1 domain-containing protein n=1 Tax=Pseudoalteromonas ulvae TaxID=107327 RepID=A0A244CR64_PSEDV|nr:hypothetical protein B1199_07085 [Pseudoalteromonas ulvae]
MKGNSVRIQQHTFYTSDLRISAQQCGAQGRETLLAVHGWQDNSASFIPLFSALEGINCIALDLPGHGQSDWRDAQAHYYFIDYVDDLYQVISMNYQQPIHLVGHSMGAMVITLFAASFPSLVKSLTLIDGIGFVTTPAQETTSQLRHAILMRARTRAKESKHRVFANLTELINKRMQVSDLSFESCRLLMERNSLIDSTGVKLTIDPKLKHHSGFRFDQAQSQAVCREVQMPVNLILAESGLEQMKTALEMYGSEFKELNVFHIEGGHHCHMDNPIAVAQVLQGIIDT